MAKSREIALLIYKLKSWAHTKEKGYNFDHLKDSKDLNEIISKGKLLFGKDYKSTIIPLDETFPAYVLNNREKFSHIIA